MKTRFAIWALCALFLFTSKPSYAYQCGVGETYDTVVLPSCNFRLDYYNQNRSLVVEGGWRHVKTVQVTARTVYGNSASIQVLANGALKQTIYLSGPYSQTYTVAVHETVRSIEFRYNSGDYVDVNEVRASVSYRPANGWNCPGIEPEPTPSFQSSLPTRNLATWLATRTIRNVDKLIPYADPETEYVPYLLPVKTVAGRAHATAAAEGDLSLNTRTAMKALSAQIVFAEPVITALMKKPVSFDMAVELLSIKHEIDDRLH